MDVLSNSRLSDTPHLSGLGTSPPPFPSKTLSVSVFGKIRTLLWERRDQCPGAVPVLVCHDEVIVECEAEQAADARAWLEKVMIEGMDAVISDMGKASVPVKVEARIAKSWGEGG